jgi:hypothetical protein
LQRPQQHSEHTEYSATEYSATEYSVALEQQEDRKEERGREQIQQIQTGESDWRNSVRS